jgi:hypothetical protein
MAQRKLLFLDFDGVLHPATCQSGQLFMHTKALARCLAGSDCEIVISSMWRLRWPLEAMHEFLLPELMARVVDVTGQALDGPHARYSEIQAYLATRPDRQGLDWRALDDAVWEFPADTPELIACDSEQGLGVEQMGVLRGWLGANG